MHREVIDISNYVSAISPTLATFIHITLKRLKPTYSRNNFLKLFYNISGTSSKQANHKRCFLVTPVLNIWSKPRNCLFWGNSKKKRISVQKYQLFYENKL